MDVGPSSSPAAFGLEETEFVLRGGFFRRFTVVSGLRIVSGRKFLTLWKGSPDLVKFLCKESVCKRPLANSSIIEHIAKQRDKAYLQMVKEASAPQEEPVAADVEEDMLAELELDGEESQESPAKRPRTANTRQQFRATRKLMSQVPNLAAVSVHREGEAAWTPALLMECATKAPAIEVTGENMQRLFDVVQADVCREEASRRHRWGQAGSRPAPRGPKDEREYFIAGRWVTKRLVNVPANSLRPYAKQYSIKRNKNASGEASHLHVLMDGMKGDSLSAEVEDSVSVDVSVWPSTED